MGHTEIECKMRSERWEDGKEWENGMFEFFDLTRSVDTLIVRVPTIGESARTTLASPQGRKATQSPD